MEWMCENAEEIIRECNERMLSLQGFPQGERVQGGGSNRDEMLVNCIDRKTAAEESISYMTMMNQAMTQLTDVEKTIIVEFYVDREGIRSVMNLCHVERSRAYQVAKDALRHLDHLLFGVKSGI